MNTTTTADYYTSVQDIEIHIIMISTILTFVVDLYQIYSQKNHKIECGSTGCHGCCNFDFAVTDSD